MDVRAGAVGVSGAGVDVAALGVTVWVVVGSCVGVSVKDGSSDGVAEAKRVGVLVWVTEGGTVTEEEGVAGAGETEGVSVMPGSGIAVG